MQQEEIIGLASDTVDTGILMYELLMEFITEKRKQNTLPDLIRKMEDKTEGIESIVNSLVILKDHFETIQQTQNRMEKKLLSKRSKISKKLLETEKDEEKRKKLEEEIVHQNVEENGGLTEREMKQLEIWTGLKYDEIIFDSDVDDWSQNASVLNERIMNRRELVFLIEDEEYKEKFGYYLNTAVIEDYTETDYKTFEFNLESHGRLGCPMKFEIMDINETSTYELFSNGDESLITLGELKLKKEDMKNQCFCSMDYICETEGAFDYMDFEQESDDGIGVTNVLYANQPGFFTLKRLIVIQMK